MAPLFACQSQVRRVALQDPQSNMKLPLAEPNEVQNRRYSRNRWKMLAIGEIWRDRRVVAFRPVMNHPTLEFVEAETAHQCPKEARDWRASSNHLCPITTSHSSDMSTTMSTFSLKAHWAAKSLSLRLSLCPVLYRTVHRLKLRVRFFGEDFRTLWNKLIVILFYFS